MSASTSLGLIIRPEWHSRAACRGMAIGSEENIFFPDIVDENDEPVDIKYVLELEEIAKSICSTCEVYDECDIQGKKESFGIWAGKNEVERWNSMNSDQQWSLLSQKMTT